MPAPYEIIVGPAEIYVAPVGEAFPDVDTAPAGNWDLVGTIGSENYGEDGVVVRSPRNTNPINVLGSTVPRKHVITTTGLEIEFDVIDATAEMVTLGYGVDPTDIIDTVAASGTPGTRTFEIPTSPIPFQRAVLVRIAQSPYGDGLYSQLQIPAANQLGNAEATFSKGDAFSIKHIWGAVKVAGQPFAKWVFQDALALT